VRTALGAGRARIARHVLIEAMTLFAVSGTLGVGVAAVIVRAVRALPFDVLPRFGAIQLDWPVLVFAFSITAIPGLVFGLIPALQASSSSPATSLLDGGRGSTGARIGGRVRSLLIVTETALAAMLLVGAGLVMRSMQQLNKVDPGFPMENVLTFGLSHPSGGTTERAAVESFFRDIRERIAAVPGVRGVALASRHPMSGADHSN
jgi:putative ABC transport system permease protein